MLVEGGVSRSVRGHESSCLLEDLVMIPWDVVARPRKVLLIDVHRHCSPFHVVRVTETGGRFHETTDGWKINNEKHLAEASGARLDMPHKKH